MGGVTRATTSAKSRQRLFVMRRFVFRLMSAAAGLLVLSAHAQSPKPRHNVAGTVTILTDGIAEPSSRATRAVNELAGRLAGVGEIRVLPIAGQGAAANVRDLLYLRGVDLAILNSDVLEFLNLTRQYLDAKNRIRYVTHLYDQKVYLLARRELNAIEDLRGRKVAVLSEVGGSNATARTLFGLLRIDVTVEMIGPNATIDETNLGKFDGALLLSDELARVRLGAEARKEWRVLPIPQTPVIAKTYQPAAIEAQELVGFAQAATVETVAVSTLLAVYNWAPSQGTRYLNVSNFMLGLFAALPRLRQQDIGTLWRQVDINASIPGWTRHPAAGPSRALGKAHLAELTAVERPRTALPLLAQPDAAGIARRTKTRVLAIGRAPLADEHLPDGGLITALVRTSLGTAEGVAAPLELEVRWTKAALPPIRSLLSDASIDISWPWEGADCERPNDLEQASAVLCDNALYSEPILQVVVGLFMLPDNAFKFENDESIFGRTICISLNQDVSALNGQGRNWLSEKRVVALRQPTLLDCVSAVQKREADAFVANDLEGRYVLARLGLAQNFKMAEPCLSP